MYRLLTRIFFLLLLLSLAAAASAQDYRFKQYRVGDGLPSDIIKGCTQDSSGYFWVATDDGLVKYDGIKFTNYRGALHSNYVKGFYKTRDGKLLVYGDLDLLEIRNLGDTVVFSPVRNVTRTLNDSSLSYPKLLFEDSQKNLWVSESQSVVKLHDKDFKRYGFDISNRSPQFLRSFAFLKISAKIFISFHIRATCSSTIPPTIGLKVQAKNYRMELSIFPFPWINY